MKLSENAELWCWPDEKSQLTTLRNWLRDHNVEYDDEMSVEELRQLYIKKEIGEL